MRTAWAMHSALITGSMPGIAASTSETWSFGSAPNSVEAPENSFARLETWAWTSMPTITSQSWRPPLISFLGSTDAFMVVRAERGAWRVPPTRDLILRCCTAASKEGSRDRAAG